MDTLADRYAALVVDLDGVVYRGPDPIQPAVDALRDQLAAGTPVAFATNNASRPPGEVAEHLTSFGLPVGPEQVYTSSMAGAHVLADALPGAARVLAIGGHGVAIALRDKGFEVVTSATQKPAAVLQGYGPQVAASDLAEAAYAIEAGAQWVATNTDQTLPTERGTAPGNGTLVAAVATATGVTPRVVGKPGPLMYTMAAADCGVGPEQTLGVGDRLDTDIAGAHAAGMDALFVLSGVHGPVDLLLASRDRRPRFVCDDAGGLAQPYDEPRPDGAGYTAGGLRAELDRDGVLDWSAAGSTESGSGSNTLAGLRIALRVLWDALDHNRLDEGAARAALPQYRGRTT